MNKPNKDRRDFLKYSAFTIGGFLVGKFLDSIQGLFSPKKGFELVGPQREEAKIFENFVVKETKKELNISDKKGNEIFIIEKE